MKEALELAKAFRQKKHFSKEAWLNRGLNPSAPDVCSKLTLLLIRCTDQFIAAIEADAGPDELKAVLKKGLNSFSEGYFDTEEKEYICELIYELGQMVDLNLSNEANSFLYGTELAKLLAKQKEQKPIDVLEFTCTGCSGSLRLQILRKRPGIPEGWVIARCIACDELNLLEFGKDAKEIRYENHYSEMTLDAGNYSRDQVLEIFTKMKESKKR